VIFDEGDVQQVKNSGRDGGKADARDDNLPLVVQEYRIPSNVSPRH
jgi:hypothetical protein